MSNTATVVKDIPIKELKPREDNLRVDVGDVSGLAASIRAIGIKQPLNVSPNDNGYYINAGHRRLAAAKAAGLKTVPCVIEDADDTAVVTTMLVENLQREDLNVIEEAKGYQRLRDLGITQAAIAKSVGVSAPLVSRRLSLLLLTPEQQDELVNSDVVEIDDALELVKLAKLDPEAAATVVLSETPIYKIGDMVRRIEQQRKEDKAHRVAQGAGLAKVDWNAHYRSFDDIADAEFTADQPLELAAKIDELGDEVAGYRLAQRHTTEGYVLVIKLVKAAEGAETEVVEFEDGERQVVGSITADSPSSKPDPAKEAQKRERAQRKAELEWASEALANKVSKADALSLAAWLLTQTIGQAVAKRAAGFLNLEAKTQGYENWQRELGEAYDEASASAQTKILQAIALANWYEMRHDSEMRDRVVEVVEPKKD